MACPIQMISWMNPPKNRVEPDLRSSSFALTSEVINNPQHLLSSSSCIDHSSTQTHTDFGIGPDHEQSFQEKVSHVETDKNATV